MLEHGPQDVEETVPKPERLTQAETATVISFVWSHMIRSFQGAITELLATAPCTRILQTLQQEGRLPRKAWLYVGDAVLEMQRALALYNSYGFGYMLGMNFRNREGKREMLWPRDLDEILANGEARHGCRIASRR